MTTPVDQAVEAADLPDTVAKALRKAFSLGQTYWQQADSEYTSQHKKADETSAKFQTLVADTVSMLARPAEVAPVGDLNALAEWHSKTSQLWMIGQESHSFHNKAALTIYEAVEAIAASRAPVASVPKGWKLVPVEITSQMLADAGPMANYEYRARGASPEADHAEWYRAAVEAAPAPLQPQDAKDARIEWPKEKRVGRREDMSPDGTLIVGLDSDNDVYVEVSGDRHGQWQSAAVEFCNGGGGGGQSRRTRAALINLMSAIEADNAELPHKAFPVAAIFASTSPSAVSGGGES